MAFLFSQPAWAFACSPVGIPVVSTRNSRPLWAAQLQSGQTVGEVTGVGELLMALLALLIVGLWVYVGMRRMREAGNAAAVGPAVAGQTPLHQAVMAGALAEIKRLLDSGADAGARDANGATPLACATTPAAARLLLEAGADVSARDSAGDTPLHWACTPELARVLLDAHADVNAVGANGDGPLARAAREGGGDLVTLLIEAGALVNPWRSRAATPLHWATTPEVAKILISRQARVNAPDEAGDTPLHWAAARDLGEVAECLLANGADLNARNDSGQTPLFKAVEGCGVNTVRHLLARGAWAEARDSAGGTPLHQAARWCDERAGPCRGIGGLMMTSEPRRARAVIAEMLLAAGADPSATDHERVGPLHFAARDGFTEVAALLLDQGVDANARDLGGRSPLDYAAAEQAFITDLDGLQKNPAPMAALLRRHGAH